MKVPFSISEVLSVGLVRDENRLSVPRNLMLWTLPMKHEYVEILYEKRASELEKLVNSDMDGAMFKEDSPDKQQIFFTAYRNPLAKASQLSVACFSREKQSVDLRLFDQRGKELFHRKHRIEEGDNRFRFDTGVQLSGIFYLAIQHRKGSQVIKLVLD